MKSPSEMVLAFHPLTPDRWAAFESLFGPREACAGCWCKRRRLGRFGFVRGKGAVNREAARPSPTRPIMRLSIMAKDFSNTG